MLSLTWYDFSSHIMFQVAFSFTVSFVMMSFREYLLLSGHYHSVLPVVCKFVEILKSGDKESERNFFAEISKSGHRARNSYYNVV